MVIAWSKKSCLGLARISANVFLVQFKDGRHMISPIFYTFVVNANEGNRDVGWVQDQGWEWVYCSRKELYRKASGN